MTRSELDRIKGKPHGPDVDLLIGEVEHKFKMEHALRRIADLAHHVGPKQMYDGVRWAIQWAEEGLVR